VKRLSRDLGLDEELLFIIYTQRVTRDATKRFYVVKNQIKKLLGQWKRGMSICKLARKLRFPPVLLAGMIMMENGVSRKKLWQQLRKPDSIKNERIKREIKEVLGEDLVYSPQGLERQRIRGVTGEERLAELLDKLKVSYLTEKDIRGAYPKTPDFLLHRPIVVDGKTVHWIESKANFGDTVEIRRNLGKQLKPYRKLFGDGIVVYWFGFIEAAEGADGILIVDGKKIEKILDVKNRDNIVPAGKIEPTFEPPEVPTDADRAEAEELAKKAREERARELSDKRRGSRRPKRRPRRRGRRHKTGEQKQQQYKPGDSGQKGKKRKRSRRRRKRNKNKK
jgi:hypothetical protein